MKRRSRITEGERTSLTFHAATGLPQKISELSR
jgi:hypothetical protein